MIQIVFYVIIVGAVLVVPMAVLLAVLAQGLVQRLHASLGLAEQAQHKRHHIRHPFFFGHQLHRLKHGAGKGYYHG